MIGPLTLVTLPLTVSGAFVPVAIRLSAPLVSAMVAPLLTMTSPLTEAERADVPEKVDVPVKLSPVNDDSLRAMVKSFAYAFLRR